MNRKQKKIYHQKKLSNPQQTDTVKPKMVEKRRRRKRFSMMMLGKDVSNIVPQPTETEEEIRKRNGTIRRKLAIKKHVATNQNHFGIYE